MGLFDKFFGPPSKDKFAQMVIDAICKAGETGSIVFDPGDFCLRKENRQVTSLANAYIEYCAADQQERKNVLKRWVRGWFLLDKEVPKEFEDIRPDLYPSVQSRAYYELMSLRTKVEHDRIQEWPHVIVGEHLAVGLIHDMKDGLRLIRDDELDTWGVTLYEALEVAVDNLKQRPTRVIGPETGEGLYTPVSDDNHDASRLLMLDMIRDFRVKGDPIAMIPTRDMLLVAGSEDCDALSRMLNLARNERDNEHHVISTVAVWLHGDAWDAWLPERDHPLHDEFKLLQVQQLSGDYRVQKELLDKLHQKDGTDIFVATYNGVRNEATGRVHTYSVWGGGITSWLPRTDIIALMRTDFDRPRRHEWNRVADIAGDLLQPLNLYPPRFLVDGFPTAEQIVAMGDPVDL